MANMERKSQSKSSQPMVTATASKKPAMKHNFRRIEIEPADNGYTMMHHAPMGEGKDYMYSEPTKTVFNTGEEMMAHLGECLGCGKAPGNKDNKGKSGKMDAADKRDMGKDDKEESEEEDD